jgi:hypothetical protein
MQCYEFEQLGRRGSEDKTSDAHASVRKSQLGRKLLEEHLSDVATPRDLVVSWDKDSETLKIKSNTTIPVGSQISLVFVKDDFPLT